MVSSDWTARQINVPSCLEAGAWHHVAVSVGGTDSVARVYVDGELKVSEADTRLIAGSPMACRIGHSGLRAFLSNKSFHGLIDEPALYGHSLSGAQLRPIALAGPWGKNRRPTIGLQANGAGALNLLLDGPYGAFDLESTSDLTSPGSWVPAPFTIERTPSGQWQIVIEPSGGNRCYRLVYPEP